MTMAQPGPDPELEALASNMATKGWHVTRADDTPLEWFQVMGERGCGTNVVRKSISKTLRVTRTEALGWKHGFPHTIGLNPNTLVVCVVRDPQAWAQSLFKRPWHAHPDVQARDFNDFLREPWIGHIDQLSHFEMIHPELSIDQRELQWDRDPMTGKRFANIFALRNAKHRGLLSYLNRGVSTAYVRLEVFNENPLGLLEELEATFSLPQTERGYRPVTRRMGNNWNASVERDTSLDGWSDADIAFMHDQLEPQIERLFGYGLTG